MILWDWSSTKGKKGRKYGDCRILRTSNPVGTYQSAVYHFAWLHVFVRHFGLLHVSFLYSVSFGLVTACNTMRSRSKEPIEHPQPSRAPPKTPPYSFFFHMKCKEIPPFSTCETESSFAALDVTICGCGDCRGGKPFCI